MIAMTLTDKIDNDSDMMIIMKGEYDKTMVRSECLRKVKICKEIRCSFQWRARTNESKHFAAPLRRGGAEAGHSIDAMVFYYTAITLV